MLRIVTANGAVPESQLVNVQGSIQLETATASAWFAMKAAAASQGVTLNVATPAGGYRSLAVQQDMHDHPENYGLNPNSSIPIAPVGQSTHGYGTRVDITPDSGNNWAIANGPAHGFVREFGTKDSNHYKYAGPTSQPPSDSVHDLLEEDMRIIQAPNGSLAIIGAYYAAEYSGSDAVGISANIKAWGDFIAVTAEEYARLISDANSRGAAFISAIKG